MFLLPGSGHQLQSLDGGCPPSPDLKTITGGASVPPLSTHPRTIANKNPIRNNKTPPPTSTALLPPHSHRLGTHRGHGTAEGGFIETQLTGQLLGHHLVEFVTEVRRPLPLQLQLQELIVGDLRKERRGSEQWGHHHGDITMGTAPRGRAQFPAMYVARFYPRHPTAGMWGP